MTTAARPVVERSFVTHEGVELVYRHWPSQRESARRGILLDRGHEHSGRLVHLANERGSTASIFLHGMRGATGAPLVSRPIVVNILLVLYEAAARVVDDAISKLFGEARGLRAWSRHNS